MWTLKVIREIQAKQALPVCRDHRGILAPRDQQVPKVIQAIQDLRVRRAIQDLKAKPDRKGLRVSKDLRDLQEPRLGIQMVLPSTTQMAMLVLEHQARWPTCI
jgi:hypothetical protein